MKDWINKFFFKYGDVFDYYLYIIILLIFMWIMSILGGN